MRIIPREVGTLPSSDHPSRSGLARPLSGAPGTPGRKPGRHGAATAVSLFPAVVAGRVVASLRQLRGPSCHHSFVFLSAGGRATRLANRDALRAAALAASVTLARKEARGRRTAPPGSGSVRLPFRVQVSAHAGAAAGRSGRRGRSRIAEASSFDVPSWRRPSSPGSASPPPP